MTVVYPQSIPTVWRSALPWLGYDLPEDLAPEGASSVQINLPMALARQSLVSRDTWDIPDQIQAEYRRFRPTPLWRALDFERAVGATVPIWVKYEGGNISGSHKLNTALAQAYYYSRAGITELVTGTGAGQWGTALAAACARFGLKCRVFMVGTSLEKKPYRGSLMRLLGAEVHASPSGTTALSRTAKDINGLGLALGEAAEYARETPGAAFASGSGETYSILHQSVIGLEAIDALEAAGASVDAVIGSVGAGSNFGGVALPFFAAAAERGEQGPLLLGAESSTTPKLTRGIYAYDKTDASGLGPREAMYTIGSDYSIPDSHSAGLRYHGAAKIISAMRHRGQVDATAVTQRQALEAGRLFAISESTLVAPESSHALAAAAALATGSTAGAYRGGILVCVSGHGFLDLGAYDQLAAGALTDAAPSQAALAQAMGDLVSVHDLAEVSS